MALGRPSRFSLHPADHSLVTHVTRNNYSTGSRPALAHLQRHGLLGSPFPATGSALAPGTARWQLRTLAGGPDAPYTNPVGGIGGEGIGSGGDSVEMSQLGSVNPGGPVRVTVGLVASSVLGQGQWPSMM